MYLPILTYSAAFYEMLQKFEVSKMLEIEPVFEPNKKRLYYDYTMIILETYRKLLVR